MKKNKKESKKKPKLKKRNDLLDILMKNPKLKKAWIERNTCILTEGAGVTLF